MCTLKHYISFKIFYEILIKTELRWGTALDLKILYNYISICLNSVTRLLEDLTSEPLEHCNCVEAQGCSWGSHCRNQNNLEYLHIEFVKFNPKICIKYLAIPLINQFSVLLIHVNCDVPL